LALIIEGMFRHWYGISGESYPAPELLQGAIPLESIGIILPKYRLWVVVISFSGLFLTWYVIERTKLGAYLRAGTENPKLLQAFGINVPLMISLAYAYGVGLAGFAGVLRRHFSSKSIDGVKSHHCCFCCGGHWWYGLHHGRHFDGLSFRFNRGPY
jgi:branched-subunit amino acid ABC-type transport system permease component